MNRKNWLVAVLVLVFLAMAQDRKNEEKTGWLLVGGGADSNLVQAEIKKVKAIQNTDKDQQPPEVFCTELLGEKLVYWPMKAELEPRQDGMSIEKRNERLDEGKKEIEKNLRDKNLMPQQKEGKKDNQVGPVSVDIVRSVMQMYLIKPDDFRLPPELLPSDENLKSPDIPVYLPNPGKRVMVGVLDTADPNSDPYVLTRDGKDFMFGHGRPEGDLIRQVVPNANFDMRYEQVCDEEGKCLDSNIIKAICFLYGEAKKAFPDAKEQVPLIINLSIGDTQPNSVLEYVMRKASEKGVVFAAAAGNMELKLPQKAACKSSCSPHPQPPGNFNHFSDIQSRIRVFPAAYSTANPGMAGPIGGVIAVGSLQQRKDSKYTRAPSSWYANWVSVSAPGRGLRINGRLYQGTSFATPIVTATLALLRAVNPNKDSGAIVQHLIKNCTTRNDLTGDPIGTGVGRVDPNTPGCVVPF